MESDELTEDPSSVVNANILMSKASLIPLCDSTNSSEKFPKIYIVFMSCVGYVRSNNPACISFVLRTF